MQYGYAPGAMIRRRFESSSRHHPRGYVSLLGHASSTAGKDRLGQGEQLPGYTDREGKGAYAPWFDSRTIHHAGDTDAPAESA